MKKFVLPVLMLSFFYCNAQLQTGSYKIFSGTIGTYAINMLLHQYGHVYKGYYYYTSRQLPIYFSGNDTTINDSVTLSTAGANKEEHFNLSFSKDTIAGTWQQDAKQNLLKVLMTEDSLPLKFTYSILEDSLPLRKNLKGSPVASFQTSSVWPAGNTTTDEYLKTQIKKLLSTQQNANSVASLLLQKKKTFFNSYLKENKDAKLAEIKKTPSFYTYNVSYDLLIIFETRSLISFSFSDYSYTGGAHGNYGTSYVSIDINTNKALHLKDVINVNGIAKLQLLLEKAFRQQFQLAPHDSLTKAGLFENKIMPNSNFYVTEKGILFSYNPYEIGPYVMGEIDLFVSFKDLLKYLQPKFKKIVSLQDNS